MPQKTGGKRRNSPSGIPEEALDKKKQRPQQLSTKKAPIKNLRDLRVESDVDDDEELDKILDTRPRTIPSTKNALAKAHLKENGYKPLERKSDFSFLGHGTAGIVYKCKTPEGKTVAVKVIVSSKKDVVEREIKEAKDLVDFISRAKKEKNLGRCFDESKSGPQKKLDARAIRTLDKHMNTPTKVLDMVEKEGKYYGIIEFPLMSGDLLGISFPGSPKVKIAKKSSVTKEPLSEKDESGFETELVDEDDKEYESESKIGYNSGSDYEYEEDEKSSDDVINHRIIRAILISVLNTLVVLHGQKRVHFDLKPENVLGKKCGNGISFALTDFGTMRDLGLEETDLGRKDLADSEKFILLSERLCGSSYYMAPEIYELMDNKEFMSAIEAIEKKLKQKRGLSEHERKIIRDNIGKLEQIGTPSDIYSLGVSLIVVIDDQKYIKEFSKQVDCPDEPKNISKKLRDFITNHSKTTRDRTKRLKLSEKDQQLLELIAKMTEYEPKDRITAQEARKAPYFK